MTCQELGAMLWTEEASCRLANAWWERKAVELGEPTRIEKAVQRMQAVPVSRLKELIEAGRAASAIVRASPFADAVDGALVSEVLGFTPADEDDAASMMDDLAEKVSPTGAVEPDRTMKVVAERWLDVIRGDVAPTSYREIKEFARWAYALPLFGENMDVGDIDEAKVEGFYLFLKKEPLAPATRKKRWGFFRRLVRYFWSARLVELPRNLDSYSFNVKSKAVKVYKTEEVRALLVSLKPRLRLYALLGLNCAMTNADIGQLRADMVDLDAGTLTRKRVKTMEVEGVPVVTYKLWSETVALLRKFKATHPVWMLTSKDNTPLYESRQNDDGTTPKKDLVSKQWKRIPLPMPFKAFRTIGATLIESHPVYGRFTSYYLGHSPKSIKDKHYAAPGADIFNEAMDWLRGEVLGREAV